MSALKLICGILNPQRIRHVDIKYHYCRAVVRRNNWKVLYIKTDENTADVFTKVLPREKFEKFSRRLVQSSI